MRVFDFVFICEDVRRTQEWFETLVCLCFLFAAKGNLRASTQHVQQATCKLHECLIKKIRLECEFGEAHCWACFFKHQLNLVPTIPLCNISNLKSQNLYSTSVGFFFQFHILSLASIPRRI
jgi:hypothetical protein